MTDRSLINTDAFVLKKLEYGEDDIIVTFFTRSSGKIKAFARHGRKSRKRFGSSLDIANYLRAELSVPKNKGSFHALNSTTLLEGFINIRKSIISVAMASYMLEIYYEMTPEGAPAPEIFDLLYSFLKGLNLGDVKEKVLPLYTLKFLKAIGLGPNFHNCVYCGKTFSGKQCLFKYDRGGIVCMSCAKRSKTGHVVISSETVNIAGSGKIVKDSFLNRISPSAKAARELRTVMHNFVEFNLGKQLNSSRFLEEING